MSKTVDQDRTVRVPSDVLMRELGDESVLLHLGSETYFGLDEMGTQFWSELTTRSSLGEAFEALHERFEVDAEALRRDLLAFVDELASHGLIESDAT
jgi:hypothetical protein